MPSCSTSAPRRWAAPVIGLATTVLATAALAATPLTAAADATVGSDSFERTVASGWGTAPTGKAWTVSGGTTSVSGGAGVVKNVGANRSFVASLNSVAAADVTVGAAFVVPTGTKVYYSAEARRQSNGSVYGARARVDGNRILHVEVVRSVNGTATILAQKTLSAVSAGQSVNVALKVSGSSTVALKAKAYKTGTTSPAWQVSANDSSGSRLRTFGKVGVSGYVSAGNSAQTYKTGSFTAITAGAGAATPTTTTPTPTPAPIPAPAPAAASGSHGAATIGTASYAVPSNAIYVSPSGNDAGSGTIGSPVRTVTKALTKASSGRTIVLRGGTYHEYFIVPPGKAVTIQNYPREAVWFDGASTVTGFAASGSAYKVDNWNHPFDASPTYVKGAPDGTTAGWTFLNSGAPMAAHPDAVWINNVEQAQVSSLSKVQPGTFFVDYGAKRLYLGSNPAGKSVAASTLAQAVSLRAPGTTIRGIGFRRYADSVPQQGIITTYYPDQHLENVEVRDSATAGIGIFDTGSTLKNVTIVGSGQMGLQASYADGLVVDNVSIRNSNDQNFNPTPSAGGFKVTTTRGITLKNSEITGTNGNQFWTDQSTYNINLLNNTITNGTRWGIVLEISSTATIANNVISGNAHDGLMISDTDNVSVWNNTIVNNSRAGIAVVQDARRIQQLNVSGHDKRRPQPDLSMPWISRNVSLGNNVLTGGSASKSTILLAEGYDRVYSAEQMISSSNGNVFAQTAAKNTAVWGNAGAYATNYTTLAAYRAGSGRDANSLAYVGSPVTSTFQTVSAISSRDSSVGQPLPSGVASKLGRAAGTRHLGAWR